MNEGNKPVHVGRKSWWMNKWFLPAFSIVVGLAMWGAFWAGGDPVGGVVSFAIMAIFGAVFFFGGKSETIRGMRGDGRDERWAMIDQQATAFAGLAVIIATLVGFGIEVAHGRDGSPYGKQWQQSQALLTFLPSSSAGGVPKAPRPPNQSRDQGGVPACWTWV